MLKNLSVLLFAAVALLTAAFGSYTFWQSQHNNDIACIASLTTHSPQGTLSGTSNYVFNDKGGVLSLNGHLVEDPAKIFNRKIFFNYKRDKDTYAMHSLRNVKYPSDTVSEEWMAGLFPHFYVYEGKDLYIKVIKQFNNNYLFFIGSLPTFSCKHTEPATAQMQR